MVLLCCCEDEISIGIISYAGDIAGYDRRRPGISNAANDWRFDNHDT
jgi:hypothetical protein